MLRDLAVWLLLAGGCAAAAIASLGMLAVPRAAERLHFAGATTLAALLLCAAVVVRDSFSLIGNKAALLGVFVLLSSPVLVHVTARAARIREHGAWSPRDDEGLEVE
jgi:multisubunit Na+/H+ antiporter MnhG subunit